MLSNTSTINHQLDDMHQDPPIKLRSVQPLSTPYINQHQHNQNSAAQFVSAIQDSVHSAPAPSKTSLSANISHSHSPQHSAPKVSPVPVPQIAPTIALLASYQHADDTTINVADTSSLASSWSVHSSALPYAALPVKVDTCDQVASAMSMTGAAKMFHTHVNDTYADAAKLVSGYEQWQQQNAVYQPYGMSAAATQLYGTQPYAYSRTAPNYAAALPYFTADTGTGSSAYYAAACAGAPSASSLDYTAGYQPYYMNYNSSQSTSGGTGTNPLPNSAYILGTSPLASCTAELTCTPFSVGSMPSAMPAPSVASLNVMAAPTIKAEPKKSKPKSKKRKHPCASSVLDTQYERVIIWDLDDTVSARALLHSTYNQRKPDGSASCGLDELVLQVADQHMDMSTLEDCDQAHIDDVTADEQQPADTESTSFDSTVASSGDGSGIALGAEAAGLEVPFLSQSQLSNGTPATTFTNGHNRGGADWMKKLALKYKHIRNVYDQYRHDSAALMHQVGKLEQWQAERAYLDTVTNRWTCLSERVMQMVAAKPSYANVIISSDVLVVSLCRLLLYALSPYVSVDNIYSASKCGRDACLDRITNRFGKKCTYLLVSSTALDEQAAKQRSIPFWRVNSAADLNALNYAIEHGHL